MTTQTEPGEDNENKKPRKRSKIKWILWSLAGVFALFLLTVLLLPTLLSTSFGKQILIAQINKSADGTVEIKDLSLGWFSGMKLSGVNFKDNAGTASFTVDEVSGKLSLGSLLRGRIGLTDGLIDKPSMKLLLTAKTETPSSSLSSSSPSSAAAAPKMSESSGSSGGSTVMLPLDKLTLELRQGNAVIKTEQPPQTLEFKNISTQVNINPAGQASIVSLALAVARTGKEGNIKAGANITPKKTMMLEGASGDMRMELVNLNLEDFKPLLALAGQKIDIAGLVNAQAEVKLTDGQFEKIQADATVENFKQTLGGKTTSLDKPVKIQAQAAMTDKGLRVDNLNVDSSFCTATCKGDMTSLAYQAKADLAGVQSFASQFTDFAGYTLAGSLNASGTVSIKEETISAAGLADFQNLVVAKGADRMPATALKVNYDLTQDSAAQMLKAASISVVADAGTIDLKDLSLPLDERKMTQLSAQADIAMDLQKTLTLVKAFAADALPKDLLLAGALRSKMNIQPKDGQIQFRTDNTTIQNLVIGQVGQTPFTQDTLTLTADGTASPDMKNYAANFDLQGKKAQSLMHFQGNIAQKARNEQAAINGKVQADYDWRDLTAMAKPFLPQRLSMEGKRSDKISFSSAYPTAQPEKMAANLNAAAAVGFDKADFMGLKFGPTEMKLDIKQGKAAIDLPDANVSGGKVRFAGNVDFAAKPMALTLRKPMQVVENVKIDDVISATLLQYLNPMFARGSNVSGTANLTCQTLVIPLAEGTPNDILLDGSVGLTDVRLQSPLLQIIGQAAGGGMDLFSIPATPFTVKKGIVRYDDMAMYFGQNYAIHFRGAIGLDKQLDMEVQIPYKETKLMLPLSGTLDKPHLDISKTLQRQGEEVIKDIIQDQLKNILK
ncbi:MAG: hypothetical protein FJ263_06655 [Planctomycetes bacterium]|nr:hypothetical protein [Planctomycetota bacterium]